MSPKAEFIFSNETSVSIDESALRNHLELILRRLDYPVKLSTEVVFVGDKKIAELNSQFRQVDSPTDVLSFDGDKDSGLLGSIVISLDTAQKQARDANITLIEETKTLAGHGLLHLLGYHHA